MELITPEQQNAFASFAQTLDKPQTIDLSQLVIPEAPKQELIARTIFFQDKTHWLHPQFPSTFKGTKGGNKYFSAEHYYAEKKAVMAKDFEAQQAILAIQCVPVTNGQFDWTAVDAAHAQVQALANNVKNFNPVDWLNYALQVMNQAQVYKFCQDETLFKLLMETGDAYLIFASSEDSYWGIGCTAEQAVGGQVPAEKLGRNLLGHLLMQLRSEFKTKGRPEWGYVMQPAPEVSFTRKRSADQISAPIIIEPLDPTVLAEEVKRKEEIDETPLPKVQEQIAIIEAKAETAEIQEKPEAKADAANNLMELFGK